MKIGTIGLVLVSHFLVLAGCMGGTDDIEPSGKSGAGGAAGAGGSSTGGGPAMTGGASGTGGRQGTGGAAAIGTGGAGTGGAGGKAVVSAYPACDFAPSTTTGCVKHLASGVTQDGFIDGGKWCYHCTPRAIDECHIVEQPLGDVICVLDCTHCTEWR